MLTRPSAIQFGPPPPATEKKHPAVRCEQCQDSGIRWHETAPPIVFAWELFFVSDPCECDRGREWSRTYQKGREEHRQDWHRAHPDEPSAAA